jgi:hypothetical protein
VSRTGYVPDSFGHPAMLPAILAGFGLGPFVHWRGNGGELERTGARWRWVAPDGSAVTAVLLPDGYFNAAACPTIPTRRRTGSRRSSAGCVRRTAIPSC